MVAVKQSFIMMVKLGNFLFRNRNGIFPFFYLALFSPSPAVIRHSATAMIIGFTITLAGQLIRAVTIGLVYIECSGRNRRVYAEELITTGIFAHCRNPLYVGNILILAGLGIASNSFIFLVIFLPLFIFFYQAIVLAEEEFLRNRFSKEFFNYCIKVNRWMPSLNGIGKTLRRMQFKWKRFFIREYNSTYLWMTGAVLIIMKHVYRHDVQFDLSPNLTFFIAWLIMLLILYLFARYLKKSKTLAGN
jgi:protein-S-isoprenylcysteine O-methyltransferase Ste14